MKTIIYSAGRGGSGKWLVANTHADVDRWFPEVTDEGIPLCEGDLARLSPQSRGQMALAGKTIVTLSPIIILAFLREIRKGRMRADDLELYCGNRRIEIGAEGALL